MALKATVYHFVVNVADSDRAFYERLDFRVAQHPSENTRYLLTRVLAFCLLHEPGIGFSKGGVSSRDEPPLSIVDAQGQLRVWIDIGAPSAERLHHAAKAAARVVVFTSADPVRLRRLAAARSVHRLDEIEVYRVEPELLDALELHLQQKTSWELVRTEDSIYIDVAGATCAGGVLRVSLTSA
jgi:uncharacterized protein YaeQ